jgi:hypothetical protein
MNYAGKTLQWMPTDTQEHFNQLIQDPAHLEYFKKQGWTTPGTITYEINSYGLNTTAVQTVTNSVRFNNTIGATGGGPGDT